MSLVRDILDKLNEPDKDMVIVKIQDIKDEYGSIHKFVDEINERNPNSSFLKEFLRPTEEDGGKGRKLVLISAPNKIKEYKFRGERIYVVETFDGIKSAHNKYVIRR